MMSARGLLLFAGVLLFSLAAAACTEDSADEVFLGSEAIERPTELAFADVEEQGVDNPPELPAEQVPELLEPEEIIEDSDIDADAISSAAVSPDVQILDVAGLTDDGPTDEEIAAFGDGHTRNSTGELVILDEPASLACADSQIALFHLGAADRSTVANHVISASQRAAASGLAEIQSWSGHLSSSLDEENNVDATVLVEFLSVCVAGGYAL